MLSQMKLHDRPNELIGFVLCLFYNGPNDDNSRVFRTGQFDNHIPQRLRRWQTGVHPVFCLQDRSGQLGGGVPTPSLLGDDTLDLQNW